MILQQCLGYYKSKISIILIISLSIIVAASYYSTYLEKLEWIDVLNAGSEDNNFEVLAEIISGYTGSYYFENFLFLSDYNTFAVLILLIGFGILLGSNMYKSLQSNYGTMIITRMSYKKYLMKLLVSQLLYMSSFIIIFFLMVFLFSILFINGGIQISPSSFAQDLSIIQYVALFAISIIHMLLYIVVIILITTISPVFLKNAYIIQLFPFLIVMITYFISSVLGNLNESLAFLTSFLVMDNILFNGISLFNSTHSTLMIIMVSTIFIGISMIVLKYMYNANIKKFGQDYL